MSEAVSADDIRDIAATLVRLAKEGDVPAAKIVLAYAIGEPRDTDLEDRLAMMEAALSQPAALTLIQQFKTE